MTSMPIFKVRRSGNSLVLVIPSGLARGMKLHEGDKVLATIEKVPDIMEFAGKLKGIATTDELNRLTNEGEDLG
jgi:antitoxin component of MazEF toxin-antitoxin module